MKKKDGGAAFPTTCYEWRNGEECRYVLSGMSLRDWFAGRAISGIMMHDGRQNYIEEYQAIAADAYQVADAMLKEREKESPEIE